MAELQDEKGVRLRRVFEQPPDAISLYSDMAQILATEHEVFLQFYETIPKARTADREVTEVTSRLRATVVLSPTHALNVGKMLVKRLEQAGRTVDK